MREYLGLLYKLINTAVHSILNQSLYCNKHEQMVRKKVVKINSNSSFNRLNVFTTDEDSRHLNIHYSTIHQRNRKLPPATSRMASSFIAKFLSRLSYAYLLHQGNCHYEHLFPWFFFFFAILGLFSFSWSSQFDRSSSTTDPLRSHL